MLWDHLWYFLRHSWFGTLHITGAIDPESFCLGEYSHILCHELPASGSPTCFTVYPGSACSTLCPFLCWPLAGNTSRFSCVYLLDIVFFRLIWETRSMQVSFSLPPHTHIGSQDSPGLPGTLYVAEDEFELLILLLLSPSAGIIGLCQDVQLSSSCSILQGWDTLPHMCRVLWFLLSLNLE